MDYNMHAPYLLVGQLKTKFNILFANYYVIEDC